MTGPADLDYLRHMLDAIDRIESFIGDASFDDFLDDELRHNAAIRQFEILGEAAGRVSAETSQGCPEIDWTAITGMRQRLIHGYLEVDLEVVWITAKQDLPELRDRLVRCIHSLSTTE